MTIMIAGIAFDQHHYDERDDVLYLNVGARRPAARSLEIDGGHAVHYDESDSIIGLTLLNVRRTIETEGYMDLMLPVVHLVERGQPSLYTIQTRARWPPNSPVA